MVVKIYISGISGNKEVKKKQQRVQMILDSKCVNYEAIDITEPGREKEKETMQQRAKVREVLGKHPLPPQIFNEEDYCGDYEDFDLANEVDELEAFLHLPVPSKFVSDAGTDQVNGSREENGSVRNGAQTTEVNGDVELTSIEPETGPVIDEEEAEADEGVVNATQDEPQEIENEPVRDVSPDAEVPETEETRPIEEEAESENEVSSGGDALPEINPDTETQERIGGSGGARIENYGGMVPELVHSVGVVELVTDRKLLEGEQDAIVSVISQPNPEVGSVIRDVGLESEISELGSEKDDLTSGGQFLEKEEEEILSGPVQEQAVQKIESTAEREVTGRELNADYSICQSGRIEIESVEKSAEEDIKVFEKSKTVASARLEDEEIQPIVETLLEEQKVCPEAIAEFDTGHTTKPEVKFVDESDLAAESRLVSDTLREEDLQISEQHRFDVERKKETKVNTGSDSKQIEVVNEPETRNLPISDSESEKVVVLKQPEIRNFPLPESEKIEVFKQPESRNLPLIPESEKIELKSQKAEATSPTKSLENIKDRLDIECKENPVSVSNLLKEIKNQETPEAVETKPKLALKREKEEDISSKNLEIVAEKAEKIGKVETAEKAAVTASEVVTIQDSVEKPITGSSFIDHSKDESLIKRGNQVAEHVAAVKEGKQPEELSGSTITLEKKESEPTSKSANLEFIFENLQDKAQIADKDLPINQETVRSKLEKPAEIITIDSLENQTISEVQEKRVSKPSTVQEDSLSNFAEKPKIGETNTSLTESPSISNIMETIENPEISNSELQEETDVLKPLARRDTLKHIKRPSLPLTKPSHDQPVTETHPEGLPFEELLVESHLESELDKISFSPQLVSKIISDRNLPKEERGLVLKSWNYQPSEADFVKEVRSLLDDRDNEVICYRARLRAGYDRMRDPHEHFISEMNKLVHKFDEDEDEIYQVVLPPPPKIPTPPPKPPVYDFIQEVLAALNAPWHPKPPREEPKTFVKQVKDLLNTEELTGDGQALYFTKERGPLDDDEMVHKVRIILDEKESSMGIKKHETPTVDHVPFLSDVLVLLNDEPVPETGEIIQKQPEPVEEKILPKVEVKKKEEKKVTEIKIAEIYIRGNVIPVLARVTTDNYKIYLSVSNSQPVELTNQDMEAVTITVVEDSGCKSDVAKILVSPTKV